jgi:hypothetical protein
MISAGTSAGDPPSATGSHSLGLIKTGQHMTPVKKPSKSDNSMQSSADASELKYVASFSKSTIKPIPDVSAFHGNHDVRIQLSGKTILDV